MHEDQANTKENIVKSSRWEIKYRVVAERVFKGILLEILISSDLLYAIR